MKWTKLKVNVNFGAIDAVTNLFLELGVEGVEIVDQFLTDSDRESMWVNYVEESLVPLELCQVVAYLDEQQDLESLKQQLEIRLKEMRQVLEIGDGSIEIEVMPDEDYEHKWKEFYHSFKVADRLVICPVWESVDLNDQDILIKIDPGMAFGSGTHETTSLSLEYLLETDLTNKQVIDVGCGSGILGIAAVKLGARNALGIDIDENAVTIAKENCDHNQVSDLVDIQQGNLLECVKEPVEVVVANILADVIIMVSPDVHKALKVDGRFIASGILVTQKERVIEALSKDGFEVISIKEQGDWCAILSKPSI